MWSLTLVLKKHQHSLGVIAEGVEKTMVLYVVQKDTNTGWLKYKYMFAKPTGSDKQTVRGHACGLSCTVWVHRTHFCFPLIMWVFGCLTRAQQQVCAEPGTELVTFIFNSSSRKTDDAEGAGFASDY